MEASNNGERWYTVADNSGKATDSPHDYVEFREPFRVRWLRVRNVVYTPAPCFSLRGLCVCGVRESCMPDQVAGLTVEWNMADRCRVMLRWDFVAGAEGYVIRYGITPHKLYGSIRISEAEVQEREMTGLNRDVSYWFAVDAFNGSGTTEGMVMGDR